MCPIFFKIGPITLHTYGVLVALGFIVGIAFAVYFGKKEGITKEKILDIGFYTILAAIIGSRLFFVFIEYKYFLENPLDIFKVWEGGLVFYGGALLVIPVMIFYFKKYSLPLWKTLDVFAPSLAIGHAIGRLGCFSAGCCYGRPTDLPWGITFTDPHSLAITGIPLHPTQLYESLAEFGNFIILLVLRKHKRFDGQLVWTYVLIYSIARFIIEFFRGDKARGFIFNGFSIAQAISLGIFLVAIIFILSHLKKQS
ncbi:MAG: prolipoprotein diacylglyceryl transferase [Deltaproteobacteria bacterium RBG_16_42_7]|nr:MAG: prolipoprotein diacylglyceryl transferase [Deltaproteobacteria bacterium RBG_16_42_7]